MDGGQFVGLPLERGAGGARSRQGSIRRYLPIEWESRVTRECIRAPSGEPGSFLARARQGLARNAGRKKNDEPVRADDDRDDVDRFAGFQKERKKDDAADGTVGSRFLERRNPPHTPTS